MRVLLEHKRFVIFLVFVTLVVVYLGYGISVHRHSFARKLLNFDKTTENSTVSTTGSANGVDIAERRRVLGKYFLRKKPLFLGKKWRQQILPNAIEIGARKGGTRALLKALTLNPNIFVSAKEIHFFDKEVNYRKGLEWYRRRMPAVPKAADTIVMEKTPAYFVTEKVPARVHEMSPDVKLILVVRDPVKRAVSDYAQLKSKSPKMKPFESYVVNGYGNVNDKENFIRIGRYCEHLDRWLKYFPLSQIHVVSGEKLVKNPAAELHEVEKFLGVKPVISEKDFIFNKTKGFPCFRDVRVSNGNATYNCLGKTKGRPHPNVQKEVLDKLYAYYRNYNARFYKMVGKDFGWPK